MAYIPRPDDMQIQRLASILAMGVVPVRPSNISEARFNAMIRSAMEWLHRDGPSWYRKHKM